MKITIDNISHVPLHCIDYKNVSREKKLVTEVLELKSVFVKDLPENLDAIIITGDLQGRVPGSSDRKTIFESNPLLGLVLADEISILQEMRELPPKEKTGVILTGDFYTDPDLKRRGITGDVSGVWEAFTEISRWVVGIAGNHDVFSEKWKEWREVEVPNPIKAIDGDIVRIDSLQIAGISGIIGNPRRPFRKNESNYLKILENLIVRNPDILILHESPFLSKFQPGHRAVPVELLDKQLNLCITGHVSWQQPLAHLKKNGQILNCHERVFILKRSANLVH